MMDGKIDEKPEPSKFYVFKESSLCNAVASSLGAWEKVGTEKCVVRHFSLAWKTDDRGLRYFQIEATLVPFDQLGQEVVILKAGETDA